MPEKILKLSEDLPSRITFREDEKFDELPNTTKGDILNKLIKSFKWLYDESRNHYSVDTYAKKLYLTGDTENLHRLKSTLAAFMMIEEIRNIPDRRYTALWSAILDRNDGKLMLPVNIRVLSWNYDSQFEKTFFPFVQKYTDMASMLQSFTSLPVNAFQVDTNHFCILRLNGMASLNYISGRGFSRRWTSIDNLDVENLSDIIHLWGMYQNNREYFFPVLNFAWEEDEYTKQIMQFVNSVAKHTTVLVIIGYSFPFFNQKADKKVLNKMKNLKKVYIQVPEKEHAQLIDRFLTLRPDFKNGNFKPIRDIEQFYVPPEFND